MSNDLLYKFGFNPSTLWIDSYLRCEACGKHTLCSGHAEMLKKELRAAKQELVQKPKCSCQVWVLQACTLATLGQGLEGQGFRKSQVHLIRKHA